MMGTKLLSITKFKFEIRNIFNKEGLDGKILIADGGIKASGELGKDVSA